MNRFCFSAFCVLVLSIISSCSPNANNPIPSGPYDGYFQTQLIYYPQSPNDSSEVAHAVFYPNGDTSQQRFNVGAVLLNGDTVFYDQSTNYYEGIAPGLFNTPFNLRNSVVWNVTGNNNMPGFNFVDTGAYPSFVANTPDTVFKSSGFTLHLQIDGADSGFINLANNSTFHKQITNQDTSITITSEDLTNSTTGQATYFTIQLYSAKTHSVNSKNYYFGKATTGFKYIYVR